MIDKNFNLCTNYSPLNCLILSADAVYLGYFTSKICQRREGRTIIGGTGFLTHFDKVMPELSITMICVLASHHSLTMNQHA